MAGVFGNKEKPVCVNKRLERLLYVVTRTMLKKVIKYQSSWILQDENIENVEHVNLAPEVQRELGCLVGEHVFLEYPWAYISRETVLRFANVVGSSLELYRNKIETYSSDTFLIGYSSTQLIACDFVICLTENAKLAIVKRNSDISKKIRSEIIQKIRKTGRSWKSLGSETTLNESIIKNMREFFEMQVCFPIKSLGLNRNLCDRSSKKSWDSYIELIPYERFENIKKKCISKMIQTHFEPREIHVQTYPGYPKNAWTQYVYEDTLRPDVDNNEFEEEEEKESAERKSEEVEEKRESEESREFDIKVEEQKPVENKNLLALFLKDYAQIMIDAVCYNTVVNVHIDDIETLTRQKITRLRDEIIYEERFSLIDLRLTIGKIISDVSWHPCFTDYVAISYITIPSHKVTRFSSDIEYNFVSKTEPIVLIWSLIDSLRPQLLLQCDREIYSISFCPTNSDFVIGGSASGQVIVWNIHEQIQNRANVKLKFSIQDVVPVAIMSDQDHSHELPIRQIQWLPNNYRIEPSGKLTKLSTCSSCQFMTISEDGTVAIWDLMRYSIISQLKPNDCKDLDELFRPTYRLNVRSYNSFFTPLYLCLPSLSAFQESDKRQDELDLTDKNHIKRLWIGTAQGHFACCTWESQVFETETSGIDECKFLDCTSAHDGPVAAILRSPYFSDILLTMGGHVFAIWKDDYLNLPVFRRKSDCVYTACCWSNRPGTFLMGTNLGELEVWDIERRANKPVLKQTISKEPITLLSLRKLCKQNCKLIGAGDCNSAFRMFEESTEIKDDILEKVDWFEEYVWREVRRKKMFSSWQKDFLQNDAIIVAKRQARIDEERRLKLEMTRIKLHREHEERLRLEAEEKIRKVPKSKDIIWKLRQQARMKKVLLQKKKFVPQKLKEKRLPLICLTEERNLKMNKARNEVAFQDKYFHNIVSLEFSDYDHDLEEGEISKQRHKMVENEKIINIYLQEFYKIRDETRKIMAEKPVLNFDWNTCVKKEKKRLQNVKNS
ncbi:WD repeat-containing protein 63-like [Nylanderia fulva]|uniref:WD repeat-containing protein 63-like n=1 Tax=Nylanderia fulva TaxID=613905 RepID=UPI0010FB5656|nr:WD repeat-containing protein 63-like [Nylanderia fulva]